MNFSKPEDIAEELERRLKSLFPSTVLLDIGVWASDAGNQHQVRVRYAPKTSGGPFMGFDLQTSDLETPIRRLTVKQWRKMNDLVLKTKTGTPQAVLDYVVDWFKQQTAALQVTDNVNTAAELASLLKKELGRLSGILADVESGPRSVKVQIQGPKAMLFEIVESQYASHFPPARPGDLPGDLAIRGKGSLKFRTRTGPAWVVAEYLIQWVKANLHQLQSPRMASLRRIVLAWQQS